MLARLLELAFASRAAKPAFASSSATRSCGRFGPAIEGTTSPRSSASVSVKTGSGVDFVRNMPCALRIGLDQRDALVLAARGFEIMQGLRIDREEAAGRAVFRRHVGDRGAVGDRHGGEARPVELDELADHALLAQHLRDGEHEVGRGHAFLQLAGELEADDLGDQHRERLAEHRGLGLDAADAPAEHRKPVDHGGVAVGADERIGIGDLDLLGLALLGLDLLLAVHTVCDEIFEVDLVADAGAGRHDREVLEGLLPPFQEPVALLVPLVFALDVLAERLGVPNKSTTTEWSMTRSTGHQRVDLVRVAAERLHGVAHGGEIDDGRNAGEILHQHAGGAEGDLLLVLAAIFRPGGDRLDVGLLDRAAVLVAQQVLEQTFIEKGRSETPARPFFSASGSE